MLLRYGPAIVPVVVPSEAVEGQGRLSGPDHTAPIRVRTAPAFLRRRPACLIIRIAGITVIEQRRRDRAAAVGMAAAPLLLQIGPACLPVIETGIAVVGQRQHWAANAHASAAPLLLARGPVILPVGDAGAAVIGRGVDVRAANLVLVAAPGLVADAPVVHDVVLVPIRILGVVVVGAVPSDNRMTHLGVAVVGVHLAAQARGGAAVVDLG
mmetsp:Transcript_2715/g.4113  ORF Transcript_2715/g.4113 Transcript_2715/m.4113 type:complete len:211 (+) Transcript_2715:793-1425(+)